MTPENGRKIVATNRKARHKYQVLDTFEAGIVLKGPEVKSVRAGQIGFQDAFARVSGGEVELHNLHISPYEEANRNNVDPLRPRKLLLHRDEIRRLVGNVEEKGLTLIPLQLYFRRGFAKVELGLARGRRHYDKREKLKRETAEREARRSMRERR